LKYVHVRIVEVSGGAGKLESVSGRVIRHHDAARHQSLKIFEHRGFAGGHSADERRSVRLPELEPKAAVENSTEPNAVYTP